MSFTSFSFCPTTFRSMSFLSISFTSIALQSLPTPLTPYLYGPSASPFPLRSYPSGLGASGRLMDLGRKGKHSHPYDLRKKRFSTSAPRVAHDLISQTAPPRSDKRGKLFAHISGSSGIWSGRIQEGGFLMINASINHSKYRMSYFSSGKRMEIGKKVVNLWEI